MYRRIVISLMLFGLSLWVSPASGAPDFKEGSWGITMLTGVPGTVRGLPIRYTNCITKKNIVPQKVKSTCTISNIKQVGNTVSWVVTCDNEKVTSEGRITYAGTVFDGILNTTAIDGDTTSQLKSTLTGQYLGPCE